MARVLDANPKSTLHPASDVVGRGRVWRLTWHALRLLSGIALIVYCIVMSITVSSLRSELIEVDASLRTSDANCLLFEQQLDELFQQQSQPWRSGAVLSPDSVASLHVWLTFDTAFAARNRQDPSLRYERAVALQRAGHCALLLGDGTRAIEHAREARRLYEDLAAGHPSVSSYVVDVARTEALLAEALEMSGKPDEALRAYHDAIRRLDAPQFPRTPLDEGLLSEWRERCESLAEMRSSLPRD